MNEYQVNDFYKNDFPIWLKKISLLRSDNQNSDWLIRPEDISLVTNEYKKHIFSLLVFYNFLIHLFMHHHFGQQRYQQRFPNLVPYKNITNTLNGLDPFLYINIPLQTGLLKESIIQNICEKVFLICAGKTINYFKTLEHFNTANFFNDFFNEPEYRIGSPAYLMISLSVVIEKLISERR
tara:strand:+ start:95 stop:634 length:540 start_codon:yes stop_codon:yes gene_type:complete